MKLPYAVYLISGCQQYHVGNYATETKALERANQVITVGGNRQAKIYKDGVHKHTVRLWKVA